MQNLFTPQYLILLGAIFAAAGALWSAQKQGEFEKVIRAKNEQIIEISNETLAKVTGGNSVPRLNMTSGGFALGHLQGEHPIYDLYIEMQELWWPLENEPLPAKLFLIGDMAQSTIPTPAFRNLDNHYEQILLPDRSPHLEGKFLYNPENMMFPETGKFLIKVRFQARNGSFQQFIAGKVTAGKDGIKNTTYAFLTVDSNGNILDGDDSWVEAQPFEYNGMTNVNDGLFLRNW